MIRDKMTSLINIARPSELDAGHILLCMLGALVVAALMMPEGAWAL